MCVKLNSLFDGEMKVYNGTDVFKHYVDISTKCFNYIHEFRNTKSHLLQIHLGQ